jgi:cytochrome c556
LLRGAVRFTSEIVKRLAALVLAVAACVPAPKKDYTPAEIEGVQELDELMRVHAKHADPLFSIRDQESFDDADYGRMKDAGELLQATAVRLEKDFAPKFEPGFAELARRFGDQAQALTAAAEGRDAAAARDVLGRLRETCGSCHRDHR